MPKKLLFASKIVDNLSINPNYEDSVKEASLELDLPYQYFFPRGPLDVVTAFHDYIDQQMIDHAKDLDEIPKISEKLVYLILKRFEVLSNYRNGYIALSKLTSTTPLTHIKAYGKTVDLLWNFINDTSKDFNFYSKRGLLLYVYGAANIYFLKNYSSLEDLENYINHKMQEVMKLGGGINKLKNFFSYDK